MLGDAEHLPFRQNSFQVLTAITVVLDPLSVSGTMTEVRRILSEDAIVMLTSIARAEGFYLTESLIEASFRDWRIRKLSVNGDLGFLVQQTG